MSLVFVMVVYFSFQPRSQGFELENETASNLRWEEVSDYTDSLVQDQNRCKGLRRNVQIFLHDS